MTYNVSKWEKVFGGDLYRLRNFLRRCSSLLIGVVPIKLWRKHLRNYFDERIIDFSHRKIENFIERYPNVCDEGETIAKIIENKISIARFGDGEFNLCIGRGISFQKQDEILAVRLREVLCSTDPRILIGINVVRTRDDLTATWLKFIIRRGNRVLTLFDGITHDFTSSAITTWFPKNKRAFEARIMHLKCIWERRKVLFVVGAGGRFFFEKELFDNIIEHKLLYVSAENAWADYHEIISNIHQYDKTWLVLISLGPTATILAYDLALEGYQAIDFGQTPGNYRKSKYGFPYPVKHPLRKPNEVEFDALMDD